MFIFKNIIKNKNNLIIVLNIIFSLIIFILLYALTIVNIENIFQLKLSDFYVKIYFLYLFISIIFIIFFKFLKIKNLVLKEELLYTIKSILLFTILVIPSFFINHNFIIEHLWESNLYLRSYWKIAFVYFALSLIISPILKFIKNVNLRDILILSRKIFWILSFIFFLKHWLEYFSIEYIFQSSYHTDTSYFSYVYENLLIRYDALSWVIAWILMLILWITSNKISLKIFWWKLWKNIQSLVYPGFIISIIHIAYASRIDTSYIFLLLTVVIIRSLAYFSNKDVKHEGKTTKYICIPCWYIYDEALWDPDWWIDPWTKFEDIPDNWVCPVCWVWKWDFEPYYDNETTVFWGYVWKVVEYKMLTQDVLEISLKLDNKVEVLKWQYAILTLRDNDWEFSRSYSIVSSENNILTFCIKVNDIWRWWKVLKKIKIDDIIKIRWIYWEFVLKNTLNPKVFIATWTWLAPIINMISENLSQSNNFLLFWVQSKKDLFYLDKIQNKENLKTHIYLSKEEDENYRYWRINLSEFNFDLNSEFYICWNPLMVTSTIEQLSKSWYKNIYFEKFT